MLGSVNIDSKGYGRIYKAVMRNRDLPLLAKTVYAYFCAYAGNGTKAFPKRDKIVRDLKINKDTYTKHLSTLVENGYISKERTTSGNIYTIMQTIPAYDNLEQPPMVGRDDDMTDKLVFQNVGAKGFGTVPKIVMLDTKLSAQAKAIYAYIASFAGSGTTAFPRRSTVMRELDIKSTNTYYKHLDQLVGHGYLSVEQRKSNGRFDVCTFRLNDIIEADTAPTPPREGKKGASEKLRHGKKGVNIDNSANKGESKLPMSDKLQRGGKLSIQTTGMSEKVVSDNPRYEKTVSQHFGQASINNISTNNSYFITEQVNNHQPRSQQMEPERLTFFSSADVKRRIGYNRLKDEADGWGALLKNTLGRLDTPEEEARYNRTLTEILNEIVSQLVETLNKSKDAEALLMRLEGDAIVPMFDDLLERWDDIRNVRAYVAASLKNLLRI